MFELIAQAAPTVAQAPQFDWLHAVLVIAVALLTTFGPVIHQYLASKNKKAATAFAMLQEAADKHEHGESWAQAASDTASGHSSEMLDLVQSAIPDRLLLMGGGAPPAVPAPAPAPKAPGA